VGSIELEQLTVSHGDRVVLDAIDLTVADRERLVLLGPSGSGKTTLLRAVAGVQEVRSGRVRIDGRDRTHAPPGERGLAMVDQQASLQPHLDVRRNLGFALRLRKVPRDEVDQRVDAEARAFSLRDLLPRRPATLSAGTRHEVALARSLVRQVSLLLLDEPFARIDPSRRSVLLRELIDVQQGYGATLLAATNDQRVAMALGHRLAVLDAGRLVQVGPPTELFRRPGSAFVAGFLGSPPMNLLPGRVTAGAGGRRIVTDVLRLPTFLPAVADLAGEDVTVGIRPTDLAPAERDAPVTIEEVVRARSVLGSEVELRLGGADPATHLVAVVPRPGPAVGELARLAVDPGDVHLFDAAGRAVAHGV
jgi:multiple sugar transport system ATP-binding protein